MFTVKELDLQSTLAKAAYADLARGVPNEDNLEDQGGMSEESSALPPMRKEYNVRQGAFAGLSSSRTAAAHLIQSFGWRVTVSCWRRTEMEDVKSIAVPGETKSASPTSLGLAVTVWLASFLFAFVQSWAIVPGFDHPAALSLAIAEAIQTSTFFPTVHVVIASLFKGMRNASSRRRIFIGWGIFIILLGIWTTWRS